MVHSTIRANDRRVRGVCGTGIEGARVPEETLGQSRVAAFSDGVFAVAIVLLILDLHVPSATPGEPLRELLRTELPSALMFVLSFAIVGITWLKHQRMFARIRRADTALIVLNLLLLLGVTVVPFTTALLARYLQTADAAPASMLYGIVWTLSAFVFAAMLGYAQRRGLTTTDRRSPAARRMLRVYALAPLGYAAGAALSFLSVYAAIAVYCAVAGTSLIPPPRSERLRIVDRA
jgi:uncharacterized membrane protein